MRMLIKGGRLIDPSQNLDGQYDILVEKGRIKEIREGGGFDNELRIKNYELRITNIDARGLWVIPGMIDVHCHLREPGYEYKETIKTGTMAGAAGGYTSLVSMANTMPVNDNASVTEYILNKAEEEGVVNVFAVGSVTKEMKGELLVDMGELKEAGVVALSDDGRPIMNSEVMRKALEYAKPFQLTIIAHCEDSYLSQQGVMNEGYTSTLLGLKGIPSASEVVMIARDIALAELTKGRVHIAHVSTKRGVELIREAKARGIGVTAEVTPHHLTLTDKAVKGFNTNAKVNPPLRGEEDRDALIEGLRDGTVDCIATDHAPHNSVDKDVEFDIASFGMVGLETAIPLLLALVFEGKIDISQLVEKVSINPSRIFNIERGNLRPGSIADITIIDPEAEWVVEPSMFYSKGRNSPFEGWRMKGRAVKTIVRGEVVYEE